MVICQNYGHFAKILRSVIIFQNHYINKILDVHPLRKCVVCSVQCKVCIAQYYKTKSGNHQLVRK